MVFLTAGTMIKVSKKSTYHPLNYLANECLMCGCEESVFQVRAPILVIFCMDAVLLSWSV